MVRRRSRVLAALVVALTSAATLPAADTLYVSSNAEPGGDGRSWNSAYRYLGDAVAAWQDGDEIWVTQGTYRPDQGAGRTAGDQASTFTIVNGMKIFGGFRGGEAHREGRDWLRRPTTLVGDLDGNDGDALAIDDPLRSDNVRHLLTMTAGPYDSTTVIDGFVIAGGNAGTDEGGAAIIRGGGSPNFRNCTFRANSATRGGAVMAYDCLRLRFDYCLFERNRALTGGGLAVERSTSDTAWATFICQSVFNGNEAAMYGGAIAFDGNTVRPQITSSIFHANTASKGGGAIEAGVGSYPHVYNSTFVRNTYHDSTGRGAAFVAHGAYVINSIFWGTEVEDQRQIVDLAAPELGDGDTATIYSRACLVRNDAEFGFWQNDPMFENIDAPAGDDGFFMTLDDGLRLSSFSVAREAGVIDRFVNHRYQDILGRPRLVDRKSDLGAYEEQRPGFGDYRVHVEEFRKGGYVLLYRHSVTDWTQQDPGPGWPGCFPGRNLSDEGREAATSVGKHIRSLGITVSEVLSSPVCRCRETGQLMFGTYESRDHWASANTPAANLLRKADLGGYPAAGTVRAITTHDAVILPMTGLTTAEVMECDAVIIRPLGDTLYEVVGQFCADTWERYHLLYPEDGTSVDEAAGIVSPAIGLHPNPVSDVLHVRAAGAVRYSVVDLTGRPLIGGSLQDGATDLDVARLAAGAYVLRVDGPRGMSTSVFVKR